MIRAKDEEMNGFVGEFLGDIQKLFYIVECRVICGLRSEQDRDHPILRRDLKLKCRPEPLCLNTSLLESMLHHVGLFFIVKMDLDRQGVLWERFPLIFPEGLPYIDVAAVDIFSRKT